jgi:hypothetical protein
MTFIANKYGGGRYAKPVDELGTIILERVPLQPPPPPPDPCAGAQIGTAPDTFEGEGDPTTIATYNLTRTTFSATGTSPSPFIILYVFDSVDSFYYAYPVIGGQWSISNRQLPFSVPVWEGISVTVWGAPTDDPDGSNWDNGPYAGINTFELDNNVDHFCYPNI